MALFLQVNCLPEISIKAVLLQDYVDRHRFFNRKNNPYWFTMQTSSFRNMKEQFSINKYSYSRLYGVKETRAGRAKMFVHYKMKSPKIVV